MNSRGVAEIFQRTSRKKKAERKGMPEKDQQPGGGGDFSANTKKNYAQTVTNEQGEKEREQN